MTVTGAPARKRLFSASSALLCTGEATGRVHARHAVYALQEDWLPICTARCTFHTSWKSCGLQAGGPQ